MVESFRLNPYYFSLNTLKRKFTKKKYTKRRSGSLTNQDTYATSSSFMYSYRQTCQKYYQRKEIGKYFRDNSTLIQEK